MLLSRAASGLVASALVASGAGTAVEVGAKPLTFLPARTPASGNPTPSNTTAKIATNGYARRIRIRMMVSISYLGRNDARAISRHLHLQFSRRSQRASTSFTDGLNSGNHHPA